MNKYFFATLFISIASSLYSQEKNIKSEDLNSKTYKTSNDCKNAKEIDIEAFRIDQGWGFDILIDGKKYIHQKNIPAVSGIKTFKTKKDALKIAKIMKHKICNNILPPTITIKEIDSLISYN